METAQSWLHQFGAFVLHNTWEASAKLKVLISLNLYFKLLIYFCFLIVPPFQISLVNGSPRIVGNTVSIEFTSSKPAYYKCALDGKDLPCKLNGMQ